MTYRQHIGKDTWHWCFNCSSWPWSNYKEQTDKPTTGKLCQQCQLKQRGGTCRELRQTQSR